MKGESFPGGSTVKNLLAMQETPETWVRSLSGEDSLEEGMATYSSILAGEFHGQRSLVSYIQSIGLQRIGHD